MTCLGVEPRAAGWKAQTNPLSYGGTPIFLSIFKLKKYSLSQIVPIDVGKWTSQDLSDAVAITQFVLGQVHELKVGILNLFVI